MIGLKIKYIFDISLLMYCSYTKREDVTEEDYATLYEEFNKSKEDYRLYSGKLKVMYGVEIPEELDKVIYETEVDRFTNFEDYMELSDRLLSIRDSIKITYD